MRTNGSSTAHITVPDLVSYFSAIAATRLDLFNREGLDVVHELIFPNHRACHCATCALAARALPAQKVM
jgi:hypothetical protein